MTKKRSAIIRDLIMNKIDVLQAMQSLSLILEDLEDEEIKIWLNNEMNGYQENDEVPSYRKTNTMLIGDVQIGYNLYPNINIPINDSEVRKKYEKLEIRQPVSTIIQMAKAEKESKTHSLDIEANLGIVNQYKGVNGDVIRAHRELSIYTYTNVLAIIKDKLLEIFKVLEKNFGNLDELYIEFADNSKRVLVEKEIINIVYNDNSIKIGDSNELKNSIIGDDNGN